MKLTKQQRAVLDQMKEGYRLYAPVWPAKGPPFLSKDAKLDDDPIRVHDRTAVALMRNGLVVRDSRIEYNERWLNMRIYIYCK